ncbi:hypothetical protein GH714_037157 [Hevea brasiliensis]|uniref:Uncharacterized protein n=1 Tax=Hevea brasiliensis TaxID=3981 RepID=A0A6A6MRV0_HEVBR|nr:hypothetical protein GH714_037157 [Hevea brasiliensis]
MKIGSCGGITRPSFLLVHADLPIFAYHKLQLKPVPPLGIPIDYMKGIGLITKFRCSVAERTFTFSSEDSFASKINNVRLGQKKGRSSSLYTHPSLLDMKNMKVANRARVYDLLRSIGIVPDELDGLELPVTVDVMRERVDFLHQLGLTIEDINNYPLVLGCSVKKNMIPVLDYLGKLGVRKSSFTDFLRRYPQVLHASVVVDLAPVVKYLQGMDIKPNDIPRVLERYPEVLGFKLEGTMSTSVAYLVGIGVARREIGGVLTRYPEILGMRVGRVIKPFVEYLESLGLWVFLATSGGKEMVCPQVLALNIDVMKLSFDYFKMEMERPLDDLVTFPAFFTYGLESTIKPRHKRIVKKGLKCSLSWLLNCSDEKFEERMDYETIDMEEMEMPSFDMNTFMEPRSDGSDFDYDEDSEDARV